MTPLKRIYEKASLCRAFEEECARRIEAGSIKFPVYLSTGQEYISATVATWVEENKIDDRLVFIQHRAHSTYLSFGGAVDSLVLELLGSPAGCANGMGGANCIQSREKDIYGHDSLLGTQVPIAVGACYASGRPTICFAGDAAAEEDYFLSSLGWAVTKKLPILFVVEDNNLSILTEKKVRRSWGISAVAKGFGLESWDCSDDPCWLYGSLPSVDHWPALVNVETTRLRWHSGAGVDDPAAFDRHTSVSKQFDSEYVVRMRGNCGEKVREAWRRAEDIMRM